MASDRRFVLRILGDASDAMKAFETLDKGAGNMGAKFDQLGKTAVRAFGAISVGAMGSAAVSAASDLEESINAVQVTFGEAAEGVLALSENSAKAVGLSAQQFNQFAVQFAGFTQQLATDGRTAGDVTDDLTRRIADFASVFNIDVAQAAQVFQSSLAGETEPIRRFGKDLSAAAVEAFALSNGLVESASEMTEAIKVQARYGLLMEQTADVAGDFENTSDSLANRTRILKAELGDAAATVGEALVPVLENVLAITMPVLDAFTALPKPVQQLVIISGAAAVGFRTLSSQLQAFGIAARTANVSTGVFGGVLAGLVLVMQKYADEKARVNQMSEAFLEALRQEQAGVEGVTRSLLINKFATGDLGDTTEALGLTATDIADAFEGEAEAVERVSNALAVAQGQSKANLPLLVQLLDLTGVLGDSYGEWAAEVQASIGGLASAERTTQRLADAEDELTEAKERGLNASMIARLSMATYSDAIDMTTMDVFHFTEELERLAKVQAREAEKQRAAIQLYLDVGNAMEWPISKTREFISQLGLLDGLSVEVQIELGLFTSAEAALKMLDLQIQAVSASMNLMGQSEAIGVALAPLYAIRNDLTEFMAEGASTPFTGGGGGGISPVDSAENDFQNYIDRVVEFGNSLLTDRFAESLFEGTPESIRDAFRNIMDDVVRITEGQLDQSLRAFIGNLQGKFAQLSELASLREELQDQLDGINKAVEASSKLFSADLDLSDDAEMSLTEQMRKRVEAARKFASDLQWLVTSGFPPAILNEVLAAGIAGGSKMVEIIKAMSMDDRSDFISAFAELDRLAEATRETVFVGLGGSEVSQALDNTNSSMDDLVDAIQIDLQSAFTTFLQGLGNQIDRLDGMGVSVSDYGATPVAASRAAQNKGSVTNVNVTVNAGVGTDPVAVGREIVNVLNSYSAAGGAPLSASLVGS